MGKNIYYDKISKNIKNSFFYNKKNAIILNMFEISIKFLGEDRKRHSQTFVVYETIVLNKEQNDPILREYISEARKSISWVPEEIQVKINMDIV